MQSLTLAQTETLHANSTSLKYVTRSWQDTSTHAVFLSLITASKHLVHASFMNHVSLTLTPTSLFLHVSLQPSNLSIPPSPLYLSIRPVST